MKTKISFIVLFLALIATPGVMHMIGFAQKGSLEGETHQKRAVELSLANILKGSYQNRFEGWFKRQSGVWPYLVKSDNQLNFWLFRQLSSNYRSTVVLGKDNNLIEKAYLKSANKIGTPKTERLRSRAKELQELQELLRARGIGFVFLISPNKPSLYPEYIPNAYELPAIGERVGGYDKFIPLLKEYEINYLDGHSFFEERKQESPYLFFSHSGTHWNDYGACLITQELIGRMQQELKKDLINVSCDPVQIRDLPSYADRDLVRITNLWTPEATYRPAPYPENRTIRDGSEFKPKALFIGTSFLWPVLRYLDQHRVYHRRNMYYYFKTDFLFPVRRKTPIDREKIDWERDVFSKDIVVLEANYAFLHKAGYGFPRYAIQALRNNR